MHGDGGTGKSKKDGSGVVISIFDVLNDAAAAAA